MSVFDQDQRGAALSALDSEGAARLDQAAPSFGYGAAYGFGMGLMKGGARVAQAVGIAGAVVPTFLDQVTGKGTHYRDSYFRGYEDVVQRAVEYWTPRPEEVGTAGRVLGGFAEMAAPLVVGGPEALLAAQGLGTATDLAREGADPRAATAVGVAQAAATAVGFRIPFLGSNLAQRMLYGAGGNLATAVPADVASKLILERAGDAELGKRFDPFDVESRAVDILAGALFGGVAHVAARDAAAAGRNAKHLQADTAPAAPKDAAAAVAHHEAMDAALEQMARGEQVTVPRQAAEAIDGATVRARAELADEVRAAIADEPIVRSEPEAPRFDGEARKPAEPQAEPQRKPAGDAAAEVDPAIAATREIVAQLPELTVRLDDGTEVRAADLMKRIEADLTQSQNDSRAFEAAVRCFLGTGT